MSRARLDLMSIAGARPNFMKIAPLARALDRISGVRHRLVHTGQHYDRNMSDQFFEELGIPRPWRNLEVGSSNHAIQTGEIMARLDPLLAEDPPDVLLVVGDVNSTLAGTLVAVKRGIPVAHIEAGLRSFDRTMPEEINRILTDSVSDSLFVTEPAGVANLEREGVPADRVFLVGNVMIDTLLEARQRAANSDVIERLGLAGGRYGLVTLHRPSNVDDAGSLEGVMSALRDVAQSLPLVFPVHPRTRQRLEELGGEGSTGLVFTEPLGYLDFIHLMERATLILTDSGGIQEEACLLGVPCLTMRENTERPITVELGMNRLVGSDPDVIRREAAAVLEHRPTSTQAPGLWDGRAAERIAGILEERYARE